MAGKNLISAAAQTISCVHLDVKQNSIATHTTGTSGIIAAVSRSGHSKHPHRKRKKMTNLFIYLLFLLLVPKQKLQMKHKCI